MAIPGSGAISLTAVPAAHRRLKEIAFWTVLLILAVLALHVMRSVTRWGVGLGSDSAVYIAVARNWLAGHGMNWLSGGLEAKPLTHHPPLYSLLLAGFQVLSLDPIQSARIMSVVAFAMNLLLTVASTARITSSRAWSVVGGAVFLASGELIHVHSWAMTEPLYLLFGLIGLFLLSSYLTDARFLYLCGASVAFSLAYLTRYAGLSLIVVAAVALAVVGRAHLRQRPRDLAVLLSLGLAPIGVWMARNVALTGLATNRRLGWYGPSLDELRMGLLIVLDWFLPGRVVSWLTPYLGLLAVLSALALTALVVVLWRRRGAAQTTDSPPGSTLAFLIAFYLAGYLAFLVASLWFTLPGPDIDQRMLSPALQSSIILGVSMLGLAFRSGRRGLVAAALLGAAYLITIKGASVGNAVRQLEADGQGYASARWRNSAAVQALHDIDAPAIYTDDLAAVELLAERHAYLIPIRLDLVSGEPRPDFPQALTTMRRRLTEGAVLALFNPQGISREYASLEEMTDGFRLLADYPDGRIYGAGP